MTFIFLLVFLILLGLIVFLGFKMNLESKRYHSKISLLKNYIIQLNENQNKQNNQLILSEELKEKMKIINQTLSLKISEINFQLFEDNYPKRTN